MTDALHRTEALTGIAPDAIPYADLLDAQRPVILKGVAAAWPLVRIAGEGGPDAAMDHILAFYGGRPVVGYFGAPEIGGRFFYDAEVKGLNFTAERLPLPHLFDRFRERLSGTRDGSLYLGSTDLDAYLPGLRAHNDLALNHPMFQAHPPLVSIWLGTQTIAAAHFDMSNNMAACVAGRRRFTLFPPDQVANLYPGPLEPTPGGQVVSMVDMAAPDFERFPRFREALAAAEVADLEPGDVLFFPALWWHQVEALEPFNILINYWWNTAAPFMDTPMNTLLHGLLSLRDRPESEKQAWRALFDYYLFGPADLAGAHLPDHARGPLGALDATQARRLRATLLNRLNR